MPGAISNGRVGGTAVAQRSCRFELKRRIRTVLKLGNEKHPTVRTILAQTLLTEKAWRLRPKAHLRNQDN